MRFLPYGLLEQVFKLQYKQIGLGKYKNAGSTRESVDRDDW